MHCFLNQAIGWIQRDSDARWPSGRVRSKPNPSTDSERRRRCLRASRCHQHREPSQERGARSFEVTDSSNSYRLILADDSADPVERLNALANLVAEGATDLRDMVEPLVNHADDGLRQWALNHMLQTLGLREYATIAIERLQASLDGEPWCESLMAAYSLGWYPLKRPEDTQWVCQQLARALRAADDPLIQAACYEALLRASRAPSTLVLSSFQRDRDVDWELVRRVTGEKIDYSKYWRALLRSCAPPDFLGASYETTRAANPDQNNSN